MAYRPLVSSVQWKVKGFRNDLTIQMVLGLPTRPTCSTQLYFEHFFSNFTPQMNTVYCQNMNYIQWFVWSSLWLSLLWNRNCYTWFGQWNETHVLTWNLWFNQVMKKIDWTAVGKKKTQKKIKINKWINGTNGKRFHFKNRALYKVEV